MSTFSRTVRFPNSPSVCGTWEIPSSRISAGGRPWIVAPRKAIVPSRGRSRPLIARSTVDLPAPLGPTMQVTEPASTSRSTPWSTSPAP